MRDLTHRIVVSVLVPLLLFHVLPCVTSQQESESRDFNRHSSSTVSVIGITVLATIIVVSMITCCVYNTFCSGDIEVAGHEVLNSIARRGLEKDVIEAFPCFLYSEVKGLKIGKGGVECAICLSEFEDEETLRWMPPCSHTFHTNCIDVWLSSRSTCPVCRANLSLKPGENFPNPVMDVETGNSQSSVQVSPEIGNRVTPNSYLNSKTPRSRSTGLLSSWRMTEIFFPRSRSTRARSSRQGYRSGSVGTKRSGFPIGRQTLRRAISMSPPSSFQAAPVTLGKDNLIGETSQANDYFGERSFERLIPEKV